MRKTKRNMLADLAFVLKAVYQQTLAEAGPTATGPLVLTVELPDGSLVQVMTPWIGVLPDPESGATHGIQILSEMPGPGFSRN